MTTAASAAARGRQRELPLRGARIVDDEAQRQQIAQHDDGAAEAVVRAAVLAAPVGGVDLGDLVRPHAEDRRHEAVEAARQVEARKRAAAIRFQAAAAVVDGHAGDPDDERIGEARRQDAQPVALPGGSAPAGDRLQIRRTQRVEEARNVGRIVLSVAVERDDDVAARLMEAGAERRRLAEVAVEIDNAQRGSAAAARASARGSRRCCRR